MKTIEIISYWEKLKKLLENSNIYADSEINEIDKFFKENLKKEFYGEPSN